MPTKAAAESWRTERTPPPSRTLVVLPATTNGVRLPNARPNDRIVEPHTQYARTSDGVDIAYSSIGAGEPLVVLPWGSLSHLARQWRYDEQRAWGEALASTRRVIRLDHRGTGLSDRDADLSLERAALDVDAVVRKEGLRRFALLGQLHTAASAILYATQHPEAVSHLILWSPFASYREFIETSPPLQAARAAAAKDWHTYTELIAQQVTAWSDMEQARRFAAYLRASATADQYVGSIDRFQGFDLTSKLGSLTMPVLVLHRRDAVFPAIDVVRKLAAATPAARLVMLDGSAAVPFLGDTDDVLSAIGDFLAEPNERPQPRTLTQREIEILALLAAGDGNKAIARALSISTRTVERHIGNIYNKIGAHNRAQATAYAFRHGIAPGA